MMSQPQEPVEQFQFRLWHLFFAVTVVAAVLAAIVPFVRAVREADARTECSFRLRAIGIALQNYHDTYQCFPAAYQVDGFGKVAHSWRVAIWPFLMKDHRSALYVYSEPWNGPNNAKLQSAPSSFFYRSPREKNSRSGMTNFVAVVGPGAAWPGTSYVGLSALLDGAADTIMVVEISNSNIHWMEPRDLPIEELEQWLDPEHKPTLLASHDYGRISGGFVVFADGTSEFLPHDTTMKRLRALLSPAGNDRADAKGSTE